MTSYKDYLITEKFVNLFLTDDDKSERAKYVDDVWDMLQKSYADQGGLLANGTRTKEDMINKIPFWKVGKVGGRVVSVIFYKDKGGRKRIALGGWPKDPDTMKSLVDTMKADVKFNRGWGEVSGKSWTFMRKTFPQSILMQLAIPVKTVIKLSPGKDIIPGIGPDVDPKYIPPNDAFKKFYYQRNLKGDLHTKIAIGQPGQKIT